MAPIPRIIPSTISAIYKAYENANKHYDSLGISVGEAATECDRALFFTLRWASQPEQITGQKQSIFNTGNIWEDRLVEDLRKIGVHVEGQQDTIRLAAGHIRGKIDGRAVGLPEAPKTMHLMEFKSSKDEDFKKIRKNGCKIEKPLHYAQCQLGMHMFGLTRAGYMVVNKNDDDRHFERIEYDVDYCLRLIARLERIIFAKNAPPKLCKDRDDFRGAFCKHKDVCFGAKTPRVTCRSCVHSSPTQHGNAGWDCARFNKPLKVDDQKEACPAHLFLPSMLDGMEKIMVDEENETITYRKRNGLIWIDGETKKGK